MAKKNWFKPKRTLDGWKKTQSAHTRRLHALASRPKSWTLQKRYRSAGAALMALANVTKDKATKTAAKADAEYFYSKLTTKK